MKQIQENLLWHKPQTLAGGGGGFSQKIPKYESHFLQKYP